MAADQLDKNWNDWMKSMSESYGKTLALLDENKLPDAQKEFTQNFGATVRKLYSEAAQVYPVRFSKAKGWCDFTKALYVTTRMAEDSLKKADAGKTREYLTKIRDGFATIHQDAQMNQASDVIYTAQKKVAENAPSPPTAKEFTDLSAQLDKATPCMKAKADPKPYDEAKAAWQQGVKTITADNALTPEELTALRQATNEFAKAYGNQFE